MENKEILEMASELKALKDSKKSKEMEVDEISAKITELDEKLSNAMTEAELPNFTHAGSTYYLKNSLFANVKAENKEALIKALKDNGASELVVEQVNNKTLSSFIKEQQELTGKDVPEYLTDIVTVFNKTTVGIKKSSK